MKIENEMCHSHLVYMLSCGELFEKAVHKYEATAPNYQHEGFNGYIETKVVFYIRDINAFTKLYTSFSKLTDKERSEYYFKVKNEGLIHCRSTY